jgi:hypothetical protein
LKVVLLFPSSASHNPENCLNYSCPVVAVKTCRERYIFPGAGAITAQNDSTGTDFLILPFLMDRQKR